MLFISSAVMLNDFYFSLQVYSISWNSFIEFYGIYVCKVNTTWKKQAKQNHSPGNVLNTIYICTRNNRLKAFAHSNLLWSMKHDVTYHSILSNALISVRWNLGFCSLRGHIDKISNTWETLQKGQQVFKRQSANIEKTAAYTREYIRIYSEYTDKPISTEHECSLGWRASYKNARE